MNQILSEVNRNIQKHKHYTNIHENMEMNIVILMSYLVTIIITIVPIVTTLVYDIFLNTLFSILFAIFNFFFSFFQLILKDHGVAFLGYLHIQFLMLEVMTLHYTTGYDSSYPQAATHNQLYQVQQEKVK